VTADPSVTKRAERVAARPEAPVARVEAAAYRIPLEAPEADGTLTWDSTTMVVVHVSARGVTGIGFTYGAGERILFDGVLDPKGGVLRPDATRPGMGLELKRADAERYRVG
jgi:hypothetical protein